MKAFGGTLIAMVAVFTASFALVICLKKFLNFSLNKFVINVVFFKKKLFKNILKYFFYFLPNHVKIIKKYLKILI
jgi:hypothetical protein